MLLEAMAAKKAIITTDSGGSSEIIRDGVTGLVVPTRDSKSIAEKIEYLIDNPAERSRLSENAQKDSKKHDIDVTVQRTQKLYEEVFLESRC